VSWVQHDDDGVSGSDSGEDSTSEAGWSTFNNVGGEYDDSSNDSEPLDNTRSSRHHQGQLGWLLRLLEWLKAE
jgi:hypothetical protein